MSVINEAEQGAVRRNTGSIMALIVIGQVMISLDFIEASTALPSIARGLRLEPSEIQWIISGMSLAFGGFMIVGGRLSDLFGQKNCYIVGIALVTIGTLAARLVNSIELLIPFRVLTGIGAAIAIPATLSLTAICFPTDHERVAAVSLMSMAQSLAIPLGALTAGLLMAELGWHGAFLLNVPFGAAALAFAPFVLPAHLRDLEVKRSVDLPGALLVTMGAAALVWSLSGLARHGLSAPASTVWTFGGGVIILFIFILWQRNSRAPLIPLSVLRSPNLRGGAILSGLSAIGGAGMVTLTTISAQQSLHFSPVKVGFMLIPFGLMSMVTSWAMSRFSKRIVAKPRAGLLVGFTIIGTAYLIMSLAPNSNLTIFYFLAALIIEPVGFIITISIAVEESLSGVNASQQGIAAAIIYTAQQIFLAIGISVLVSSIRAAPNLVTGGLPINAFAPSFLIGVIITLVGIIMSLLILRTRSTHSPAVAAE